MSALPSGGTATSPLSRRNGCLKSRRTNRSSSRCCATLCATGVWPTSLAKLNYVFGLAGIFAAIQAAKLTSQWNPLAPVFRRLAVISIWIFVLVKESSRQEKWKIGLIVFQKSRIIRPSKSMRKRGVASMTEAELLKLIQSGENIRVEFKKSTTEITKDVYDTV